jgi:hypothetical protein
VSATYDPGIAARAITTDRYSALVRTALDLAEIQTWDRTIVRDARLLVPVDLQALYVPAEGSAAEPMVRLPSALRVAEGEEPMPQPFADGSPRPPGVHLHWALPDALLRGRLQESGPGPDTDADPGLALPVLPDRWAVVRILAPRRAAQAAVRGWVLEADQARAVPFALWPAGAGQVPPEGEPVPADRLTAVAGQTLGWVASYDGTLNRFAFHDPLDDLGRIAEQAGDPDNAATYVVAGWWSDPRHDPLDGAYTGDNVHERITALGWTLEAGGRGNEFDRALLDDVRSHFTLVSSTRFAPVANVRGARAAATSGVAAAVQSGPAAGALVDRAYAVTTGVFGEITGRVDKAPLLTTKATLLHGAVHGVPVRGQVPADLRPRPRGVRLVLGRHADDLAAGLAAPALAPAARRRDAERLLTAFTGNLLRGLGTADGLAAIEEREHAQGFESLPGGDRGVDRLVVGASAPSTSYGRSARSRTSSGQPPGATRAGGVMLSARLEWADLTLKERSVDAVRRQEREVRIGSSSRPQGRTPLDADQEVREVTRPAPRFFLPLEPVVAVAGGTRSLRFGRDGRGSPDALLHCRWPSQVAKTMHGVLAGRDVLPSLGTGGVPAEVLLLAREALLQSPYLTNWLAEAAAVRRRVDRGLVRRRLLGEAALRFGAHAAYSASSAAFSDFTEEPPVDEGSVRGLAVAGELRRFSAFDGVDPDVVAVTAYTQPWLPVWLEWEARLTTGDGPSAWELGPVDLERPADPPPPPGEELAFTGRTILAPGTATQLATTIGEWLREEVARGAQGQVDADTERRLAAVRAAVQHLDVLTGTLDGIADRLLGLPYDAAAGGVGRVEGSLPAPVDVPRLLVSGRLRLTRARLLDTFGRTLDLDTSGVTVPVRSADPAEPGALRLPPRVLRPSRWMFRLVDAGSTQPQPAEAFVDQADPAKQVSPVAGFLLPDHIDEALEVFDAAGEPLGQLLHEPVGGGVVWEIAPGREGPVDAGPGHGLAPAQASLGWLAAGLVAADATAREGRPAGSAPQAPAESALSALLRVVDTTLWSYDPYAALGGEHVAGLVGRPLAVVRARLWLEVDDDLDELDLSDPAVRSAREAAYRSLAEHGLPVRVGELTRSDDGLIAFFVDGDFSHVRVVDKVVATLAREAGRMRGYLTTFGRSPGLPGEAPVDHPYVAADDELRVHLGQVVTLTLLMHPAGAVHLTSGVLPRKSLRLARDWVSPGLGRMAPSVRVGPVLVDPEDVRMPKVASLGKEQTFTRRTAPYTWRDDPILAATQAALLPAMPAEAQEGWIRVTPETGEPT